MDFSAEINVRKNADNILKLLQPESISRERSTVELKKEGDNLKIIVDAKDAVALRASVNAIMQVLSVHSRMEEVSE